MTKQLTPYQVELLDSALRAFEATARKDGIDLLAVEIQHLHLQIMHATAVDLDSAAPDMLAALKEADLCFGDQSREDVQSYWDARAEEAEGEGGLRRDLVRAACRARIYAVIAKAEGRTND